MKLRRIAKTSVLAATAAMAISVITATGASAAPQSGVPNGLQAHILRRVQRNLTGHLKMGVPVRVL